MEGIEAIKHGVDTIQVVDKLPHQESAKELFPCQKTVSTVILGAKDERQVMENVEVSDGKSASSQALRRIQELYKNNFYLD